MGFGVFYVKPFACLSDQRLDHLEATLLEVQHGQGSGSDALGGVIFGKAVKLLLQHASQLFLGVVVFADVVKADPLIQNPGADVNFDVDFVPAPRVTPAFSPGTNGISEFYFGDVVVGEIRIQHALIIERPALRCLGRLLIWVGPQPPRRL